MLVIADTSPFIGLLKIGQIDVMPRLYGSVVIPPQVAQELAEKNKPALVQDFIVKPPAWLSIRTPTDVEAIPNVHVGECAAISLAREIKADLLLIDDRDGRDAAIARNIRTLRTTAMLLDAAKSGALADLGEAFDKLAATDFRVKRETLDELLKQYEAFKSKQRTPNSPHKSEPHSP